MMIPPKIKNYVYDRVLPIAVTTKNENVIQFVSGTATRVSEKYYITAEHVIKNSCGKENNICLAFPDFKKDIWIPSEIKIIEKFSDIDLVILEANDKSVLSPTDMGNDILVREYFKFPPDNKGLGSEDDIINIGFPFNKLSNRSYKGYIVSNRKVMQNEEIRIANNVWIYELSHYIPEGLSGSPVFQITPGVGNVLYGIALGTIRIFKHSREQEEFKKEEGCLAEKQPINEIQSLKIRIEQLERENKILGKNIQILYDCMDRHSAGIAIDIRELLRKKTKDNKTIRELLEIV